MNYSITNNIVGGYKVPPHVAVIRVQRALRSCDSLRKKQWRGNPNPLAGHCYIACEAVKELSNVPLRPAWVKHEGTTHWFLRDPWNEVIDPTASQFKTPVPYDAGRGCGFLTKGPSRRARHLLGVVVADQINPSTKATYNSPVTTVADVATYRTALTQQAIADMYRTRPTPLATFALITGLGT